VRDVAARVACVVFLSLFHFSRQRCDGLKSLLGLGLVGMEELRRDLCRDIMATKVTNCVAPPELCRVGALTRGYIMPPPPGAKNDGIFVAFCREAILGDRRRLVASLWRAGTCFDFTRSVALGDATVRATEQATEVNWKRACRQPASFEATLGKKP
jgi:hypothetical protein